MRRAKKEEDKKEEKEGLITRSMTPINFLLAIIPDTPLPDQSDDPAAIVNCQQNQITNKFAGFVQFVL
jgi:hypothetical protein